MRRRRAVLPVAIAGVLVAASQAGASGLPPLSLLVARVSDVPVLAHATITTRTARSPAAFAVLLHERTGAELSPMSLEREGFREAVLGHIKAPGGEVASTAMVFRSRRAASRQEAQWITQYHSLYRTTWVSRQTIGNVPGSVVAGIPSHFRHEFSEYRLAFFSEGRCSLLESVIFTGPQLRQDVADTLAGASTALYTRARTACV